MSTSSSSRHHLHLLGGRRARRTVRPAARTGARRRHRETGARSGRRRRFGKSKDHRDDLPQVVIAMAVTRDGIPVRCWTFPGSESDQRIIRAVKNDLGAGTGGRWCGCQWSGRRCPGCDRRCPKRPSSGSRSIPAAALTVAAVGAAGLVEWPVLLPVGGTVLGVHYLTHRSGGERKRVSTRRGASRSGAKGRALARGHRRHTRQQGHALRVRRSARGSWHNRWARCWKSCVRRRRSPRHCPRRGASSITKWKYGYRVAD